MLGLFLQYLFRFTGDIFHLYTIYILLTKIKQTKSVSGLSLKTQFLYLLIYITRYTDLLSFQLSSALQVYNFFMKILFISSQFYLIFLIRKKYYFSYDLLNDNFNVMNLTVPCFLLSFFLKAKSKSIFSYTEEFLYAFSVLLESVAILPQLIMLQEKGDCETLTGQYILCLGLYRLCYLVNWIVKYLRSVKTNHLLVAGAIVQCLLYVDFFVVYYKYVFVRKDEKIPSRMK